MNQGTTHWEGQDNEEGRTVLDVCKLAIFSGLQVKVQN